MNSTTYLWEEKFDDLLNGTILDEGNTAWSVDLSKQLGKMNFLV